MARQVAAVESVDTNGLLFKAGTPAEGAMGSFVDAHTDGHSFSNDGDKRTLIAVDNSDGSVSTTLTIESYKTLDGLAIADRAVTVAAGDLVLVRPGPTDVVNRPDGTVWFGVSPITDVRVAVVKVV